MSTLQLKMLPILQKKVLSALGISASDCKVRFSLSTSFEMLDTVSFFFGFSIGSRKAYILKTAFALSLTMSLK